MQISIIICCFNRWAFTKACLNDLFKLNENDHEIIVIDNASSDETNEELSRIDRPNFHHIRNDENLFHSKACNIGFDKATGDNIVFMNNDIRVRENASSWTDDIVLYCKDHIIGTTMGQLDNNLNFIKEANKELDGNSYLSGWIIASSRKNFNKISVDNKVWNEEFPFYFNDTDLSFRARELGVPLKVIGLPVVHFGKVSARQLNVNKLYNEGRTKFIKHWSNKV